MVKNLIFLGAPGVGKGTIANILASKHNIRHVSTGDIFRYNIKKKTPLGKEVEDILAKGDYVSNELTNKILLDALLNVHTKEKAFILDGYPRTMEQAQFLIDQNIKIHKVILLVAPEKVIIKRLSGRRICPIDNSSYHLTFNPPNVSGLCDLCNSKIVQRPDDHPDSITKRLRIYNQQTKMLIDFYREKKMLIEFSADDNSETIANNIVRKFFNGLS